MRRWALILVPVLAVTACTSHDAELAAAPSTTTMTTMAAASESVPFPKDVSEVEVGKVHRGVIDCGSYSRSLGMAFDPDPFPKGHACIVQASDTGSPAVLIERWELTGGGTSTSEYRVIGPGEVVLIGRFTGDENMSDVDMESRCEGLVMNQGLLEGATCVATRPPP